MAWSRIACIAVVYCAAVARPAAARQWTDSTGKHAVEADLVLFDDETVVLKKDNHDLVAVPIAKLSNDDQQHLKKKEVRDGVRRDGQQLQTWSFRGGRKAVGRIVDYVQKDVVLERRLGNLYVNGKPLDELPEVYQWMVPRIVGHFEKREINDKAELQRWLTRRLSPTATFPCEGVLFQLENGDQYGIPFFFFAERELEFLKSGWDKWLAARQQEDEKKSDRDRQTLFLQSMASQYQQDRMISNQVALFQAASDWIELWQVQMAPKPGVVAAPLVATVPAQNSQQARVAAAAKHPTHVPGAVKKLRRNY